MGKRLKPREIFKVIQGDGGQLESFVRFSVEIPNDPQIYQSF